MVQKKRKRKASELELQAEPGCAHLKSQGNKFLISRAKRLAMLRALAARRHSAQRPRQRRLQSRGASWRRIAQTAPEVAFGAGSGTLRTAWMKLQLPACRALCEKQLRKAINKKGKKRLEFRFLSRFERRFLCELALALARCARYLGCLTAMPRLQSCVVARLSPQPWRRTSPRLVWVFLQASCSHEVAIRFQSSC